MDIDAILRTATAAATGAVAVHQAHLGQVTGDAWDAKGAQDFVSYVDREAEAAMAARIRADFPASPILAEEADYPASPGRPGSPAGAAGERLLWILDPLDGTTNYLHRYPA